MQYKLKIKRKKQQQKSCKKNQVEFNQIWISWSHKINAKDKKKSIYEISRQITWKKCIPNDKKCPIIYKYLLQTEKRDDQTGKWAK